MDKAGRIATVGMFDGVHRGHRTILYFLLDESRNRHLHPSVFTFDNHPLSIINPTITPKLLNTAQEKKNLLNEAGINDCIFLEFNDYLRNLSAQEFLQMLNEKYNVKALILGFNNKIGHDGITDFYKYCELGKNADIEIIKAPEFKYNDNSVSSSIIRKSLQSKQIVEANKFLGYNYFISGNVVTGKQLGRKIGFPTANINIDNNSKLIPPKGVYAVSVIVPDGTTHPAMLNIGQRPTVDGQFAPISIEAHIFNFNEDLYDKNIKIEFIDFLREETQFPSIEQLIAQLNEDKINAMKTINRFSSH